MVVLAWIVCVLLAGVGLVWVLQLLEERAQPHQCTRWDRCPECEDA